jgi:hypothetical protein
VSRQTSLVMAISACCLVAMTTFPPPLAMLAQVPPPVELLAQAPRRRCRSRTRRRRPSR